MTQVQIQVRKKHRLMSTSDVSVYSRVKKSQFPKSTELIFRLYTNSRLAFPDDALAQTYVGQVETLLLAMDGRQVKLLEEWLGHSHEAMSTCFDYLIQFHRFSYGGGLIPVVRDLIDPRVRPVLNRILHLQVQT